ncbi:MAG TPA: hypothetical protein VL966_06840 [Alphaproteobacteria bacterium]|jgi:hypothetical protein|nr:hypothetical protein [Alphaproteobacteria bacterium]
MVTDKDPLSPGDYHALWKVWEGRSADILGTHKHRLLMAGYIDADGDIRVTDQGRTRLEGVRRPE